MKRLLLALPLLLLTFACEKDKPADKPADKPNTIKDVNVEQVADWMKAKSAIVLDANTDEFRSENGVIPGAVLLRNYLDWDPTEVLGTDKTRQLVFYCTSRT
jgi:hypothetical protein